MLKDFFAGLESKGITPALDWEANTPAGYMAGVTCFKNGASIKIVVNELSDTSVLVYTDTRQLSTADEVRNIEELLTPKFERNEKRRIQN